MPTVKGKIIKTKKDEKGLFAIVQFNGRFPKENELLTIHWGAKRSESQNAIYWVFLNWLINDAGLKEQGHFDPMALHFNLKAHFLAEKIFDKGKFRAIEEATTTTLNKIEFGEYLDKIDKFMKDFFKIDTQPFWDIYARDYKL